MKVHVGLGLHELYSGEFARDEMLAWLVNFARAGLTREFVEPFPDAAVRVRYQGRSFTPTLEHLEQARERVQGEVTEFEIKAVGEGGRRSHVWVPGYTGSPRMLEFQTTPGGAWVRRRVQALEPARALARTDFLKTVFETAHEHQFIVVAP